MTALIAALAATLISLMLKTHLIQIISFMQPALKVNGVRTEIIKFILPT